MLLLTLLVPLVGFLSGGFLIAHFKKDNSVADILWGLYFILLTSLAFVFYAQPDLRQILILVLVLIWGLRLSGHIFSRHWGKGEDPRYTEMKKSWHFVALRSYFQVFFLQGVLALAIVSPVLWVQMQASAGALGWLDFLGLGVWIFGFLFEVIGDAQLGAFVKTKKPGEIMERGLWHYTRHPNYFGEVTQWWGLFIIALSVPFAWIFCFGPLLITGLILFVSGVPLLEKKYEGNPAWEIYKKKTSKFIPWFPKAFVFFLGFSLFLNACGTSPVDSRSNDLLQVQIVFAGDLDSGGSCADHGTDDACNLFTANVDLNSGEVLTMEQVTDTDTSESYPAWNPNGEVVYYSIFKTVKEKDVGYVDLQSQEAGVLISGATWPEVSPDGNIFLYVLNKTKKIMQASLSADGLTLGTASELTGVTNQQDPAFSFDGSFVVFHDTSEGEGEGAVFDPANQETVFYGSRSGHCSFGILSFSTLCDNVSGGGLFRAFYEEGVLSEAELYIEDQKPSVLAEYDPDLSVCGGTSFNYPTFCGDDEHVLVSTSCNEKGTVTFSRLFIVDLSEDQVQYYPLGKNLEEMFNGPGKSTWTVDCLQN